MAYLNIKQHLEKGFLRAEFSCPMNVAWYRIEGPPDIFARVLAVADEKDGEVRYLDLMKPEVQDAVMAFTGSSAKMLFNGPYSRPCKIVE